MIRWVLLRGLTREAGHWGRFPALLAERLGRGHQVLALDLPGNGSRHHERSPASVAGLLHAVRRQVAPGRPVVVVAMSLGAMVALEWARVAPRELKGAVLVNTSAGGHSPFWDRLLPRNYLTVGRMLLPGLSALDRERRILAMTTNRPADPAQVLASWAAIAAERPVRPANALRQLWAAARWRTGDERPAVPLLLLASEQDRLVSPRCSQELARRWQLDLRLHPWAGHDLPLEDPDWVVDQVHGWPAAS